MTILEVTPDFFFGITGMPIYKVVCPPFVVDWPNFDVLKILLTLLSPYSLNFFMVIFQRRQKKLVFLEVILG